MSKKLFSILLCGFLVLGVVGCGNEAKTDSSNQSTGTNESFNAKKIEKNISITEEGIAADNTVVASIKNKNKEAVDLEVEAVFYDEEGNALGNDTAYLSIYNNQEMACNFYNVPENYSDYEIKIKANDSLYKNFSNKVEVKDNNTGEQLAVQVVNNAGKDIENVDVAVVFYQDGKIVGFGNDLASDLRDGETSTSNIYYPYDENYDDVSFDEYKVFVSAYNYAV